MRHLRSQRGFTLIELMTVLAIVAVMTLLFAGLSTGGGKGSPNTTADQVVGMMGFARLRAEAKRTTHKVQIEPTVISVWEADSTGFVAATYAQNKVVSSIDIPSGVVVWNTAGNTQFNAGATPTQGSGFNVGIEFKPDGTASYCAPACAQTGSTVFLTDVREQSKYRVFVYRTTGNAQARDGW
jgi:prepilin-type N-terminal cleavage/methylation domain-containing protein